MKTSILKTLSWQLYLIIYLSFYGSNDEIICVSTKWHIVWNPRPVLYRHTDHGPTLNIPLSHESWISNISNLPWLIIKHNTCSFWSHESRAMLLFISSVYSSWQNNSEWCLIGCLQCGTINYWMINIYSTGSRCLAYGKSCGLVTIYELINNTHDGFLYATVRTKYTEPLDEQKVIYTVSSWT